MEKDAHQTRDGLREAIQIKSFFSEGQSKKLSILIADRTSYETRIFPNTNPLKANWIAGFVTADGNFTLGYTKRSTSKFGYRVNPR